jgi:hypothetical protein
MIIKYQGHLKNIAKNSALFVIITIIVGISNIILILPFFDPSELVFTLEMVTGVALSFLVPIIFILFEYNVVTVEKATLKDQYSHDMAQFVQTANARVYLISNNNKINEKTKEILKDIEVDHMKIGELIKRIREI